VIRMRVWRIRIGQNSTVRGLSDSIVYCEDHNIRCFWTIARRGYSMSCGLRATNAVVIDGIVPQVAIGVATRGPIDVPSESVC